MGKEASFVYIFIACGCVCGLCASIISFFSLGRALKGTEEMVAAGERDEFMRAARAFLDARFSRNPLYAADPPGNALEAYEYYRSWVRRFAGSPWRSFLVIIAVQLAFGLGALSVAPKDFSYGAALAFILASMVLVGLVTLLNIRRFVRKTAVFEVIDGRFQELAGEDRAALTASDAETRSRQASRFDALDSEEALLTDLDIETATRDEAWEIYNDALRKALFPGFIIFFAMIGLGFALTTAFNLGDVLPYFFIAGFVGLLLVICVMITRASKKRRGAAQAWRPASPRHLPEQPSSTVCKGCGWLAATGSVTCPHCGRNMQQP